MLIDGLSVSRIGRLYLFGLPLWNVHEAHSLVGAGCLPATLANLPYTSIMVRSSGATPTVKNINSRVLRPREALHRSVLHPALGAHLVLVPVSRQQNSCL